MKNKNYLVIATISLAIAIMFGAMGAHSLKKVLDVSSLEAWKTAVFYQIIHSFGLLFVVVIDKVYNLNSVKAVLNLMTSGFILFSTSIYLLSLNYIFQVEWLGSILGPLTPIGGLLMISSWIVLSVKIYKYRIN